MSKESRQNAHMEKNESPKSRTKLRTKSAKVILNPTDREACARIMLLTPTVRNTTDAVRYAIHFTDRLVATALRRAAEVTA